MTRRAAVFVLVCVLGAARVAAARPHVYLIVVDGLAARLATPALMPRLFGAVAKAPARSSVLTSRAAMPARTNSNHATLVTGAWPDAHGITGNAYWSRTPGAPPQKLDDGALLEVETLFTVAETTAPELVTAGLFGKPKLARLFAAVPGRQRAPDVLWSPATATGLRPDPATGDAADADTMAALLHIVDEKEPDFAFVNLSDVDRIGHGRGPESEEYARAVSGADAAIGRLLDALARDGRWEHSIVIVTTDHGFTSVAPTAERPKPVIHFGGEMERVHETGVHLVADGGIEHVYADAIAAGATDAGGAAATLARVARLALDTPGVAEVLARLPVPGVARLAERHPDWHLEHQRAGDLLLVAVPGYVFVDPWDPVDASLLGNHGGPEDLPVPLVVIGGDAALAAAPRTTSATSADVAPTIAALLGLRAPRRLDGSALDAAQAGRPLAALLAQSPH